MASGTAIHESRFAGPTRPGAEGPRLFLRGPVLAGAIGLIALFFIVAPTAGRVGERASGREAQGGGEAVEILPDQGDEGLAPRAVVALDLYLGPSEDYQVIGVVHRGAILEIVGRDPSGEWLAVAVAPAASLYGWVPRAGVRSAPDAASLPIKPVAFLPRR